MAALSITTVVPVADVATAVAEWSTLLGAEPTFVDGDRWAQFDVGGTRLALAGTDRPGDAVGVMVKVNDMATHVGDLRGAGFEVEDPTQGAHEMRSRITHADGSQTMLYSS